MELLVIFRSIGATYTVYTNILLSLFVIFVYQPLRGFRKLIISPILNSSFILLTLFGLSYVVFGVGTIKGFVVYFITPLLLFWAGWVLISVSRSPDKTVKQIIVATMIGNGIHAFLNTVINIGNARGSNIDYFTMGIASDTISGSINIIILSTISCIFIEKDKKLKTLYIISVVIALIYALQLATRSTFIIAFLVFVICFFYYVVKERNRRKIVLFVVSIVFVLLLLYCLYHFNIMSFQSFVYKSNMMERLRFGIGNSNATRFNRFLDGLRNLFRYPMGSSSVSSYYHNTWLDVARIGGIIPFFFYLLYSIVVCAHVAYLQKNESMELACRFLILCVYFGVFLNLFFEPGMEGYIELIYEFTMINGMVESLYCFCESKTKKEMYCETANRCLFRYL